MKKFTFSALREKFQRAKTKAKKGLAKKLRRTAYKLDPQFFYNSVGAGFRAASQNNGNFKEHHYKIERLIGCQRISEAELCDYYERAQMGFIPSVEAGKDICIEKAKLSIQQGLAEVVERQILFSVRENEEFPGITVSGELFIGIED